MRFLVSYCSILERICLWKQRKREWQVDSSKEISLPLLFSISQNHEQNVDPFITIMKPQTGKQFVQHKLEDK